MPPKDLTFQELCEWYEQPLDPPLSNREHWQLLLAPHRARREHRDKHLVPFLEEVGALPKDGMPGLAFAGLTDEEEDELWDMLLKLFRAMKGFGPKQTRNLWQFLGYTRYEIPLDSRVTSWLNDHVVGDRIEASRLGSWVYYESVMDAVQELCRRAGVLPCMFDAAVFSLGATD